LACVDGNIGISRERNSDTVCIRRLPTSNTFCIVRNPNYDLIVKNMILRDGRVSNMELVVLSKSEMTYNIGTVQENTAYKMTCVDQFGREFLFDGVVIENDVVVSGNIWLDSIESKGAKVGYTIDVYGVINSTMYIIESNDYENVFGLYNYEINASTIYIKWFGSYVDVDICRENTYTNRDFREILIKFGASEAESNVDGSCGSGELGSGMQIYL